MSVKPKYEELVQRVRKLEKEATGRQQAEKIIRKSGAIPMDIMYFEDVEVGNKRTKSVTYQVKKEEIIEFARHWDPRSFHIDEMAAVSSVFGGLVACSAHIFSILSWFATHGQRRTASMAALGFDKLRMHHPVRPGDTLSCCFTYLEKRESQSKQDRGIVRTLASISNQQNIEVFSAIVTSMVAKRPR